jgi:hypothetical protein
MIGIGTHEMTKKMLPKTLVNEIQQNGIPVPLRGQLWPILVRNKLRINSQLFEIFKMFPFSIQAGIKNSD